MRTLLVSLLLVFAARGQERAAFQGVVSGVVVSGDGTAAQALRRVSVTLDAEPARTQMSDEEGRFTFDNVPEGRYIVFATKPGYVPMEYGATRYGQSGTPVVVAPGQPVPDLRIQLPRGAAIAGTILGADGRPVPNAAVVALTSRVRREDGTRQLASLAPYRGAAAGPVRADARGEFRVFDLPSGSYALRATTSGPEGPFGPGHATVYYPSTLNPVDAGLIHVDAGEEHRVTLTLVVAPAVARANVEGGMTSGSGTLQDVRVRILGDTPFNSVATVTNDRFAFAGVTPGTHLIEARAVLLPPGGAGAGVVIWGQTTIAVNGKDVGDVGIPMQPATTVSGRVEFEGGSAPVNPARVTVTLRPVAPWVPFESIAGNVGSVGDFAIANVPPGRYRVDASAGGPGVDASTSRWSLKSFVVDGHDALDAGSLSVAPGESVSGVVMTMTSLRQNLAGTVRDADGHPTKDLTVVVFPKDRSLWMTATRRIRSARPDTSGWYVIDDLPAGDYLLVALRDVGLEDLADPAFIASISVSAMPVSLAPGERKQLDLRPRTALSHRFGITTVFTTTPSVPVTVTRSSPVVASTRASWS